MNFSDFRRSAQPAALVRAAGWHPGAVHDAERAGGRRFVGRPAPGCYTIALDVQLLVGLVLLWISPLTDRCCVT